MTVDLEAIRARLAAATPRPWVFNGYSRVDSEPLLAGSDAAPDYPSEVRPYSLWQMSKGKEGAPYWSPEDQAWLDRRDAAYDADWEIASVPAHHGDTATGRHRADAELIAHAPDDLEALLALVDQQAARIAELERETEQLCCLLKQANDSHARELKAAHGLIRQKHDRIAELEADRG